MTYREILEGLGYRLKDHGAYWRTNAIYRSGDNSTALQIYKDTGVWKDYVEDSIFLPFEALLQKTMNISDLNVIKSYIKSSGVNIEARAKPKNLLKEEKTYPISSLEKLLPHHDFYLEKGISENVLKRFRCGLAMSGKMYQRMIFPIFRKDGRIHGFSGRKVINDDNRPKWLHVGSCSDWMYPLYSVKGIEDEIINEESVFIVESIGDCLSMYENKVKNTLVSFGLNISPKFISKLNTLPLKKIFISFNNDSNSQINRGFEGAVKSIFKLSEVVDFKSIYFAPPSTNDFGEMSKDEMNQYVQESKNLDHQKSMDKIIDIAKKMEARGINKSFSASLKKLIKQYNFYYGSI